MAERDLTIGVITFHRPELLAELLHVIGTQEPSIPVLVVDNDRERSAQAVVASAALECRYVNEPRPGVAHARNRLLDECRTRWLTSIDDDELPHRGWTDHLRTTALETGAALVAGPVLSRFEIEPDPWIRSAAIFDRPRHGSGTRLRSIRGGNLLFDVEQVRRLGARYDPRFNSGGEDIHFSLQVTKSGGDIVWSDEAVVEEFVSAERLTRQWVRRRWADTYCNHWRARVVSGESGVVDVVGRSLAKPFLALGVAIGERSLVSAERELAHARGGWRAVRDLTGGGRNA